MNAWFVFGVVSCWFAAIASLAIGLYKRWLLFIVEGALFGLVAIVYTAVVLGYLTPLSYARFVYQITPALYVVVGLISLLAYRSIAGGHRHE